jgi:hypothetical protein
MRKPLEFRRSKFFSTLDPEPIHSTRISMGFSLTKPSLVYVRGMPGYTESGDAAQELRQCTPDLGRRYLEVWFRGRAASSRAAQIKGAGRQGIGSFSQRFPCFNAMPCRPTPLIVYFRFFSEG